MRRAARWDGAVPIIDRGADRAALPPPVAGVREAADFIAGCRAESGLDGTPFDLAVMGGSPADPGAAGDIMGPLAEAGATWWQECGPADGRLERLEPMLRRAEAGPPRLD